MSVRFAPFLDQRLAGIPTIVLFTFDRTSFGNRVCVWANDEMTIMQFWDRCRLVANCLWRMMQKSPQIFHDVPVDVGDGTIDELIPENVFCFARKKGRKNPLLPNPYLMRTRKPYGKPLPFQKKNDVLYFRGSSTGYMSYEANRRVALCLAAKSIQRSNCAISSIVQVDNQFVDRMNNDQLIRPSDPLFYINHHRFAVDVDGNTSSWDRFYSIASYGSVPIRFECEFEECWHHLLVDGEHFVVADRQSLGSVVENLRSDFPEAKRIATNASGLVKLHLSPNRIQQWFEQAWMSWARKS